MQSFSGPRNSAGVLPRDDCFAAPSTVASQSFSGRRNSAGVLPRDDCFAAPGTVAFACLASSSTALPKGGIDSNQSLRVMSVNERCERLERHERHERYERHERHQLATLE